MGGNGGYLDLRGGGEDQYPDPAYQIGNGGNGGWIELKGGDITEDSAAGNGGYIQANGAYRSNGGYIELNAGGDQSNGGYIKLNGGGQNSNGGYIEATGHSDINLGYLAGGFINLNSTEVGPGGSLNLSAGGGSIDTRGQGQIQFGNDTTRTLLSGSATQNRTVYLPDKDCTLASDDVIFLTGDQIIYGNKNFINNIQVSGTGIFNNVDFNNIDIISLSGVDITITNGNVILTNPVSAPNIVYNTGNQTISGIKTFFNSGVFSSGAVSALPLLNNPLSVVGSGNSYLQLNIQNRASGTSASADLVITANNGTDNSNYINLGINNSGYNDNGFTNGTGLDGYLFIDGGNLDIGTKSSGKFIEFHAGGTTQNDTIARISSTGLNIVSGNLTVSGTRVLLSGQNSFVITLYNTSDAQAIGHNYFGNMANSMNGGTDGINRKFPVLESCVVRRASWTQLNTTVGSPSLPSTGYFINTTTSKTGIISTIINTQSTSAPTHYTAEFSTPIVISNGDYIVCSLFGPTYTTTAPAGQRNTVNIYCYN